MDWFKQEQVILKETAETLKIKNPEALKFHMLPKMHKISNLGKLVITTYNR